MIVLPDMQPAPWRAEQFRPIAYEPEPEAHEERLSYVGELLKTLITAHGGVRGLARAMGVHRARIQELRRGKRNAGPQTMERLEAMVEELEQ